MNRDRRSPDLRPAIARLLSARPKSERLLRSAAPNAARAVTLALVFAFNVVIARSMGPEDSGHFFTAIVVITLLGMIGRLGADMFVLKHASALHRRGTLTRAAVDWRWLTGLCLWVSVGAATLALLATVLFSASPRTGLPEALVFLTFAVPFQAVAILNSALLRSVGRAALGAFAEMGLSQGLAMIGVLALASRHQVSPVAASGIFVAASAITAMWSIWEVRRSWPAVPESRAVEPESHPVERRQALNEMTHMMGSGVLFYGLTWLPVLGLAVGSSPTQAAFFMAAIRYPNMISVIPTIQMTAVVPQLAGLFRMGFVKEVNARVRSVNFQAAAVAIPVGLGAFFAAEPLIGLFGPDFSPAVGALRVLVLGQVLVVLVGFVNPVMMFADLEKTAVLLAAAALVIGAPLSILAARSGGALGAATAYTATMFGYALVASFIIQRRRRITTYLNPFERGSA